MTFLSIEFCTSHYINSRKNFVLQSKPKYIILGHSHPECAYNDSLIDNFKNLSQSGESYFYAQYKLRELLKANKSISTVFIEFTNNLIEIDANKKIWDDKYLLEAYPKYAIFIDKKDNQLLIENNIKGYLQAISINSKKKIGRIFDQNFDYTNRLGGYQALTKTFTPPLNKITVKSSTDDTPICMNSIYYLNKMIHICKEYNVKPILIRSPLHKSYSGYCNENLYQNTLKVYFNNIEFMDFAHFPIEDKSFADSQHLNAKGSTFFSIWFNQQIKGLTQ